MLKPKKRVSKREIKEDKLVKSYFEVQSWYMMNKRKISTIMTILVVGVVAGILVMNNMRSNNEKASGELGNILRYYDQGNYQAAINGVAQENIRGLLAIVNDYGSTHAGSIARFMLANSYYAMGDFENALKQYEETDLDDEIMQASAYAGSAACFESKSNFQAAAGLYEKAALLKRDNPLTPEYLHAAAVNYSNAEMKQKAIELLKRLKKEYPTSSIARDVDRYIAQFSS
jgi:tetratricopeptide (TPR) repeat protein